MESIDDLLAELKAEYKGEKPPVIPTQPSAKTIPQILTVPINKYPVKLNETDLLLREIQAEYHEQEQTEKLQQQEAIRQQQIKQQQLLSQQKEALKKQAEEWLKHLDPLSEEGLWFEEFSYKYPSKLEAATDYLQALRGG